MNGNEIKSKLALYGITQTKMINYLTDKGYTISRAEFSQFLNLKRRTRKAEIILSEVEKKLERIEARKRAKANDEHETDH